MNNDVVFAPDFFEDIAKRVYLKKVYITEGVYFDWRNKKDTDPYSSIFRLFFF